MIIRGQNQGGTVQGSTELHTKVWWVNLRQIDHFEDYGAYDDNIKMYFKETG